MLIYHVAKKSCDLRVTFVNETCTNKQLFFFSVEGGETKKRQHK